MKWEEFEELAYQGSSPKVFDCRQSPHHNAPIVREEEFAAITSAIETLRIPELLTVIRDDVWQSGTIQPVHIPWDYTNDLPALGFRLASEPYPKINISGTGRDLSAHLFFEQTSLNVYVTGGNKEYKPMVHVVDKNTYTPPLLHHTLEDLMKIFGISGGIARFFSLPVTPIDHSYVDPFDRAALAYALSEHSKKRERMGALPKNIALRGRLGLQQIEKLQHTTELTPKELRDWAYDTLGTPTVMRLADRALPGLIQL